MGDTESCSSRAFNAGWNENRKQRLKVEVYNEVLSRLRELNVPEAAVPGFEDELWTHFYRLPTRHALDMNVERAQDVLMHKRLLHMTLSPSTRPAVEVRLVQVRSVSGVNRGIFLHSNSQREVTTQDSDIPGNTRIHPPPAFGSSANLQLALEASQLQVQDRSSNLPFYNHYSCPMHEITISTIDKPKLLSQLTSLLSETGLNIQEAHAFSTLDGYSLDVFVVGGWVVEDTEKLKHVLTKKIQKHEKETPLEESGSLPTAVQEQTGIHYICNHINRGNDIWEIDTSCLKYETKIASGSFSDLYKGTFNNHDVAIKVLKTEHLNESIHKEFAQEVYILSKIQHKNIVQFVGACKKPPNLCIVTEYMCGGSMYDLLRRHRAGLTLPSLLRAAINVSEGMNYLHQNGILHRDLKAANLLMDEKGGSGLVHCFPSFLTRLHKVVKVADFGVARMHDQSGIMTAETGTYRWMAPEVIEHKPYDHKADVFSFGIVLWELLTGKLKIAPDTLSCKIPLKELTNLPYEHLSPLQAAVGVVQKGLRPTIPKDAHLNLVELLRQCWRQDPSLRPEFAEILEFLQRLANRVAGAV